MTYSCGSPAKIHIKQINAPWWTHNPCFNDQNPFTDTHTEKHTDNKKQPTPDTIHLAMVSVQLTSLLQTSFLTLEQPTRRKSNSLITAVTDIVQNVIPPISLLFSSRQLLETQPPPPPPRFFPPSLLFFKSFWYKCEDKLRECWTKDAKSTVEGGRAETESGREITERLIH